MTTTKKPTPYPRSPCLALTALVLLSALFFQWAFGTNKDYLWSNTKNVNRPIQYHGHGINSNFFEGWYFKLVKDNGSPSLPQNLHAMAIIVGIYRPTSESDQNGAHAFVIPLGLPGPEKVAYYRFSTDEFTDLASNVLSQDFRVQLGNSLFAHDEIVLDLPIDKFDRIPAEELESFYAVASSEYETQYQDSETSQPRKVPSGFFRDLFPSSDQLKVQEAQQPFAIKGHFRFPGKTQTPLPTSPLVPSIMGFIQYIPFLECNHGVSSLYHPIQEGRISTLDNKNTILATAIFDGGIGYTEKDWGINFPSTWVWTQTNIFKNVPGSSMLFSLASIPVLGPDATDWVKAKIPFAAPLANVPGRLMVYYHATTKTLYNFSSYMAFARIKHVGVTLNVDQRSQTLSVRATTIDPTNIFERVSLEFNVTREIGTGAPLRAPSRAKGAMVTAVEETILGHTSIKLWRVRSGEVIVEDEGIGSGLEIVGDIRWLEKRLKPWF
ncbi:hypothetical protein BGZ80_004480 [Entomortierella chlamydospora]|uniref:Uncharacterized protein n=1 Tax=Entomortierella chlamydospora TaxID=101097 RepID=A0A9P6SVV9_9FUNG|nr:hypothetical protein BGZ79_007835 [Entomortierella chlamydospora]KAG0007589.1 hypothetical protein BGZ80_004480 [Entomortierella chlamydospora]